MAKQTGVIVVKLNGKSVRAKGSIEVSYGGVERTEQFADGVVEGYSEKPVAAMVKFTATDDATSDVDALRDFADGQIALYFDTGVVWTGKKAFSTKPPDGGDDGKGLTVEIKSAALQKAG